ncbi:MAG: hypothetical protein WC780_14750 [Lentimicrobiaceae bacterium]|jgi:hypothetical protein
MNSTYLKNLRTVYFAMAMGIVLFMLVTYFVNSINGPLAETDIAPAQRTPFMIALLVLTGAIFMIYRAVFPKKLEAIKALPTLSRKLAAWRELSFLHAALIEAPAFFAIVLFLLLGVFTLLIWPVAGIFLFWLQQPTRAKLIREANLSSAEIAEFDSMN